MVDNIYKYFSNINPELRDKIKNCIISHPNDINSTNRNDVLNIGKRG